jgi:hypothetical protein
VAHGARAGEVPLLLIHAGKVSESEPASPTRARKYHDQNRISD